MGIFTGLPCWLWFFIMKIFIHPWMITITIHSFIPFKSFSSQKKTYQIKPVAVMFFLSNFLKFHSTTTDRVVDVDIVIIVIIINVYRRRRRRYIVAVVGVTTTAATTTTTMIFSLPKTKKECLLFWYNKIPDWTTNQPTCCSFFKAATSSI